MAAPTVFAHSDVESTSPRRGASLSSVPGKVTVTFTKRVLEGAEVIVKDGCGEEAGGTATLSGRTVEVPISGRGSGRWRVEYRAFAAADAHPVEGSFSFRVQGSQGCPKDGGSRDDPGPTARTEPDGSAGGPSEVALYLLVAGTAAAVTVVFVVSRRHGTRR